MNLFKSIVKWYYTKTIYSKSYIDSEDLLNKHKRYKYFIIKGNVDLFNSYIKDISNITFKNKGSLELPAVNFIPDDYIFYNTGSVFLNAVNFEETNAGQAKRNLKVINQNGILKIRLGCFFGTKEQALEAVYNRYTDKNNPELHHLAIPYANKIKSAFEKYLEKQKKV